VRVERLLVVPIFAAYLFAAPPDEGPKPAAAPKSPNRALLDQYCVGCHNQKAKIANLTFDKMDVAHPGTDPAVWEKVVRKLQGGMMPPPGMRRPDPAAVNSFVTYLETSLDQAAAAKPNPGSVALHRLNRVEYQNAIRDLFAIDVDAAALLPTDDISSGFDNIASVLKVSPSFLDQYITAARAVTIQAIGTPPPPGTAKVTLRAIPASDASELPLGVRGGTVAEHLFPAEGDYEISGVTPGSILTVDGAKVGAAKIHLKGGIHKIALLTPDRSIVENEALLQSYIPGNPGILYGGSSLRAPRGPGLQVTGPYNPVGPVIESANRQKLFVCRPSATLDETACASKIFANIAHRAYRRPITDKDLAPPLQFFKEARKAGEFETAIQGGLIAIIASPKFLYRAEPPPQNLKPGSVYRVNDLELASRLSFFLWSSIPDDQLLAVAEQGKLKDPAVFQAQVRRMLADPKAKSLVTNFAFEWLRVREVDKLDPDPVVYPNFDPALRTAFKREMELWMGSIFQENRSVLDLLTSNYTYANERLARHYGIPDVLGDEFRRVTLPDSKRYGLLGKGAELMVTAYPNRTSPVLRGAFILESITGTPPSPPPPNVEAFKENKEGEPAKTVRQIMEQHRANPTCNACHGIMDPLGFSLENFDTIGKWRDKDKFAGTRIDATGTLIDGSPVAGPDDLRKALMKRPEQFVQTLTEKLATFGLGRVLDPSDMPGIRKMVRDAARDNYRFNSLVMGIVTSPQFQSSVVPDTQQQPATQVAQR
jgi:mono/diheme cytochrome c family protein